MLLLPLKTHLKPAQWIAHAREKSLCWLHVIAARALGCTRLLEMCPVYEEAPTLAVVAKSVASSLLAMFKYKTIEAGWWLGGKGRWQVLGTKRKRVVAKRERGSTGALPTVQWKLKEKRRPRDCLRDESCARSPDAGRVRQGRGKEEADTGLSLGRDITAGRQRWGFCAAVFAVIRVFVRCVCLSLQSGAGGDSSVDAGWR